MTPAMQIALDSQSRLDADNQRRKRLRAADLSYLWWEMPKSTLTLERDPKAILGGLRVKIEDGEILLCK